MSLVQVRAIRAQDWSQLWPVFQEIVAEGETYTYPQDLTVDQAMASWTPTGRGVTVVAEEDGVLLGAALIQPNRPGRGAHVATASFMVSSAARGRGVGRLLGQYVLSWATDEGFRAMQFNAVVDTNTAAVGLWESLGFATVGVVPEAFDSASHGLVGLRIMHRFL